MNIVPKDKHDIDTCNNLLQASDIEVEKNIIELLEWIQDINWPVARYVCKRLKDIKKPLVNPIKDILNGDDDIWKYWVITNLLSITSNETVYELKNELESIISKPTKGEKLEEVDIVAKELLSNCH